MPVNLTVKYPNLLILSYGSLFRNLESVRAVFDRDFEPGSLCFTKKKIHPIPSDDEFCMDILFKHLTHKISDETTMSRGDFDQERTIRIHWIKPHLEQKTNCELMIFSTREKHRTFRTYIYNKKENYVIVLNPLRCGDAYYLCSAYKLEGKDSMRNKIVSKYKYRLDEVL